MALFLFFLAAPPPPLAGPSTLTPTTHPSVTIIAGVLAAVFSITFLLLLYAKYCMCQDNAVSSSTYGLPTSYRSKYRNSGVARAVVSSLPVFRFGSLTGPLNRLECAICMAAFEAAEALRLLPKCCHAFHVECVDTWLEAHASCPLCRSRVHPDDVHIPVALHQTGKRVSGRYSSALEKSKSSKSEAVKRKDGLLLPATEETGIDGGSMPRFSHRIVVECGGVPERWSEAEPSQVLFLPSQMILSGKGVVKERCLSENLGLNTFPLRDVAG